ncbi:TPA: hypothetical protein DEP58_00990 [Patescibacteria group bacterium]|nr:MAG: hypothetical protein UU98_C0006G0012 [Parcubacteria group bacterium GW2011_GWD2_42_14]HCC04865.1 hypothetical protein [Patescibacteria group bacterium]
MQRLCYISLFLVAGCIGVFPYTTYAVQIFLDTTENTHNLSDTFYIPVRIDTQGECINAVTVEVAYNPDEISIQDVSTGESVLTLWTQFPLIQKNEGKELGQVLFEGGIPGGYCGRVIGDPGQTNILAKLVVTGVRQQEFATDTSKVSQVVLGPATKAYLHDGSGTEAPLTLAGSTLVLTYSSSSPNNLWLSDVKQDVIAPELFEITLVEGPSVGSNKHYIAFNTTDKQSGVDHYEVLETDPDRFGFLTWTPRESYWVIASSPYELRDQNLHSKILVKAVDKNGNERIVTYTPPMSPFVVLTQSYTALLLVGVLVFIVFLVLYKTIRRKRRNDVLKNSAIIEDDHGQ